MVARKDLKVLLNDTEARAQFSIEWWMDNGRVVSASMNKLIIACSKELRKASQNTKAHAINVDEVELASTQSEKMLGMVINQNFTWGIHLRGEHWSDKDNWSGLVPQFHQKLEILK